MVAVISRHVGPLQTQWHCPLFWRTQQARSSARPVQDVIHAAGVPYFVELDFSVRVRTFLVGLVTEVSLARS